ncbi:MAG: hypothetical protein LBO75_02235 [Bifidobacteriaceae bacterium]|jgi:hypothetical protein|nr:hypothetical protein [Bifidobacteriaceae bacterium]
MRTTIDIPPGAHARIKALAEKQGRSFSATASELVISALRDHQPETSEYQIDPRTGLVTFDFGRTFTIEQVAELIDEDQ